ncbi:MAG: arsenic resistance N-acetyltransferase ArsN2 [Bacteroidota bacterium]
MKDVQVRKARAEDLPDILSILDQAALPLDGVQDHLQGFLLAENPNGTLIGSIALELYGKTALVRSAAIIPSHQRSGLGSLLLSKILEIAREHGVQRLLLLTTTAEKFFQQRGFHRIDADTVRGPVRASTEFSGACPSTATRMEMVLS